MKKQEVLRLVKAGKFDHTKRIMPIKKFDPEGIPIVPFKHQVAAYLMGVTLNNCGFLMEQGTGKTLSLIATIGYRYLKKQIKRVIIFCPLSVASELELQFSVFANYPHRIEVLAGNRKKRDKCLQEWEDTQGVQILIINYEASWIRLPNGRNDCDPLIKKWKPNLVACDESQKLKNGNSSQTRAICKISKSADYKIIMTGTPISQSPLDFFGQFKFLDMAVFGRSFTKFKARYAVLGEYNQILHTKNVDELITKAHSMCYRVSKKECLDLPPLMEVIIRINLGEKAKNMYNELHEESILEFKNATIVTPRVISRNMKLAQICGGFIKYEDNDFVTHVKQIDTAKLKATLNKTESLVSNGSKIIIFARFTSEIKSVIMGLRKLKIPTTSLTGAVKFSLRKGIIADFQNPKSKTKVIVIQTQAGGVGITLTQATEVIFYSRDFNNGVYEQAKARAYRIGQKNMVTIYHMVAKGTIDTRIARALINKQNVSDVLIDEYCKQNYKRRIKGMRYKLEPYEYEYPKVRHIKLDFTNAIKPEPQKTNYPSVVELDASPESLDSLINQMEEEIGVAEQNEIDFWGEKETAKGPRKSKRDKTSTPKTKAAPKEKKVREKVELLGDVIPLKQLAEQMGVEAKHVRVWLRKQGMETKSGKWEWEKDDPQLDDIQTNYQG